jgi:uncharacterized protein
MPTESVRNPGEVTLDEKVRLLRRPEAYPERPSRVQAIETHMSWVFLTDRFAYKLKKPVHYDVLDFSTLWRRRRSCLREVRLNRRLAPEVYRGVVPLTLGPEGVLALGGTGPPVEWLVEMDRLPAHRMLDRLIASGGVPRSAVEPAAELLAEFYHHAIPAMVDEEDHRQHLREGIQADRDELVRPVHGLPVRAILQVVDSQLRQLDEAPELFDRRVREGRIVEGHGDLRPEHICLHDPPAIFDCLEFSRDLRMLDPVDELSFLGLECLRLGAPHVGDWFLATYRDVTGDCPAPELLSFYRRFRGLRRAKIAIWHLSEPGSGGAAQWRERAAWYLDACSPDRLRPKR